MKRLFVLALILSVGFAVQAAPKGPQTYDEFIAQKKAAMEKTGKEFDEAKAKKEFDKKDTNKDGVLSVEELTSVAAAANKQDKAADKK